MRCIVLTLITLFAFPMVPGADTPLVSPVTQAEKDQDPTDELGHSRRPFNLQGIPEAMRPMFADLDTAMKTIKKKYHFEDEHCSTCGDASPKDANKTVNGPYPMGGVPANPENPMGPRLYIPSQTVTTFTISRTANHPSQTELTKGLQKLTDAGQSIASIQQIELADNAALVIVVTTPTRMTPLPTLADLEYQFRGHSAAVTHGQIVPAQNVPATKPWTGPAVAAPAPKVAAPTAAPIPAPKR